MVDSSLNGRDTSADVVAVITGPKYVCGGFLFNRNVSFICLMHSEVTC